MIPSTLFALVGILSSLVAVNGAVIERDGTFTYLTPQPTAPGQAASTTTTTTSSQSSRTTTTQSTTSTTSSVTPTASTTPTTTSTTSATITSATTTQSSSTTTTRSTTPTTTSTTATTTPCPLCPPTATTTTSVCPQCPPATTTTSPPGAGTVNCNGVQQWQASLAYTAGDRVIFNGQLFTARQWTYNNAPPTHADQWTAAGTCAQPVNSQANCNGVAAWQSTVAYTAGNRVTFNGHLWSAVQWTQANAPGDTSGSWKDQGACA